MKELKELGRLLFGFLPWIIFLFYDAHSLEGLKTAILICLIAAVVFGFRELRRGFILQWGTLIFFSAAAILINGLRVAWFAENMGIVANSMLAAIIWATIAANRPFALQYARAELPKERWEDPALLRGCRFISAVWGALMLLSVGLALFHKFYPQAYGEGLYFDLNVATVAFGAIFTTIYKARKRAAPHAAKRPQ